MNSTSGDFRMEPVDYLRSGACIVAFVGLLFVDDNMWMLTEMIISASLGLSLVFFSGTLISYVTTVQLDPVLTCYCQLIGFYMIGSAICCFYLRRSHDKNVRIAVCLERCVCAIGWITVHLMSRHMDPKSFTPQQLTFAVLGLSLWLLRNLFQLSRFSTFGGGNSTPNDRFNKQMLFHMFLLLCLAPMYLGFPKHLLGVIAVEGFKVGRLHIMVIQVIGCIYFSNICFMYNSFFFESRSDRRAVILAGMIIMCLSMPLVQFYQYKYNLLQSGASYGGLVFCLIMTANYLVAYFYPDSKHHDN